MNTVTALKFTIKRPKWIIANLMETTQAAPDSVLGYRRGKKVKKHIENKVDADLTPSTRNEHSYSNVNTPAKIQRDVFGATILPSNLSFDNMKKLSMNQIKLEDIPLVDENEVAEVLLAEKVNKARGDPGSRPRPSSEEEEVEKDRNQNKVLHITQERENKMAYLDFTKSDSFYDIPGPRLLEKWTSMVQYATRHTTVFFLLRLLQSGSTVPFRKYGPICRLPQIMGGRILLVNSREHISAIQEQDKSPPHSSSLDILECSRLRRHGKQKRTLFFDGNEWEERRKGIDKILLKDEEKYFDNLEETGNLFVRYVRSVKNNENEVPENFITDINRWSLECLFQILFDKSFGFLDSEAMTWPSKNAQLLAALRQTTRNINMCESGVQLWRLMRTYASVSLDSSCRKLEAILSDYVYQAQMNLLNKEENSKIDPLTFTEALLATDGLTKNDVITFLLDALLIGMNAMTNALSFLLYNLARNPRTQLELVKEIKKVLPETYSRLEYDQLKSLECLQACLTETLRLNMPMPILMKYLSRDVILSNFQIPRDTFVLMTPQLEALKEENFECAKEFRPRRWMDAENKQSPPHLLSTYSKCSSQTRLAEISVITCAAQIIRNFRVEFNYGKLSASNSTISYPSKALKFSFHEREG